MAAEVVILRLLLTVAVAAAAACVFAATASAQVKPGDILVVDPNVPPASTALLFRVDPQNGARTVIADFGGSGPNALALEADGSILVTDSEAGTDPSGGASEWGALFRLSPDPATGELTRSVLSDFGDGANTGRNPRAVTVEADGHVLVINGNGGTANRALLVRIDPDTGARTVVTDFGNDAQGSLGVEPRGVAVEADGRLLVIDAQAGTGGVGELVRVDPQSGARTSLTNFRDGVPLGANPTSVAVEATGQILVTDEGHTSTTLLGLLFRVDPQTGARTVLSDFNTGANTGQEPEGVALEASGQILVVDKHAGPANRGMLFRVDPASGARAIVSDFGAGANGGSDPLAVAVVPGAVVPPSQATLTVVNEVVNDDGGTAAASAWTIAVTGANPNPAGFPGAGAPGTTVTLDPGAYTVAATGPAGYTTGFSPGCAGTIAAGETKTCTITNDDQASAGPCILLSDTAVSAGGTASTPSTRRFAGPEPRLTVTNCGGSDVSLRARGTDATGPSGIWRLTNASSGGEVDSTCGLGLDIFRADVTLWNSQGGGFGTPLTTRETAVLGEDGATPFVLAAAAAQEFSPTVEMPCVGSVGLGEPMTMDITFTALAP